MSAAGAQGAQGAEAPRPRHDAGKVLATDPASVIDFKHFCETAPFELLGWQEEAGVYAFRIRTPG